MKSAGVIGWPVAHSKSPLIHRFWLAKLGIDGDYGRFAVQPDALRDAIRALPALGLCGVNVTVPHKVAVMAYLDRVDDLAAKVGAVNTVIVEDGALVGYNTDVAGFLEPLDALPRTALAPGPSWWGPVYTLVGTGGAARAVAVALHKCEVTVVGRDSAKAAAIAGELVGPETGESAPLARVRWPKWEGDPALPGTVPQRDRDQIYSHVVINASTLGMTGNPPLEINLDNYPDDTIVYDIVYAPLETPLLAAARARGLRTIDGLSMLIGQAAAAFELFFGHAAPREHDAELRALLTRTSP